MSHERWHLIEKIQVEVAAVVALAIVYLGTWGLVRPADVDGTIVFLPINAWAELGAFTIVAWLLAAVCAVLTISARFEGAVLALLVGLAGLSFRTEPMLFMLNRFEDDLPSLMKALAIEIIIMAIVLILAAVIIRIVRSALGALCPAWMLPAHLAVEASDVAGDAAETETVGPLGWLFGYARTASGMKAHLMGLRPTGPKRKGKAVDVSVALAASFGVTLLVGLVLMIVTLKSTGSIERGQILFALAFSFFVAAAGANYFFPSGVSLPCWIAPVILAVVVYAKTCWVSASPPLTWSYVDALAHILPIDWLSAGCGGAIGGYWFSCRLLEMKHVSA